MKNAAAVLNRQIEEMRQWLDDGFNEELLYKEPLAEIIEHLENPSAESAPVLAVGFSHLETWVGASGADAILGSHTDGWYDLRRALEFNALSVCLYRHLFETDPRKNRQPRGQALPASLGLVNALAFNDSRLAVEFGSALLASFADGGLSSVGSSPLDSFSLSLWSRVSTEMAVNLQNVPGELGVYTGIDSFWEDSAGGFNAALLEACDYHMKRTFVSDDISAEFDRYPYNVFPAEILAVFSVRRIGGKRAPRLDHPLLETALALPPSPFPVVEDPLLDRAWEFVKDIGVGAGMKPFGNPAN